MLIESKIKIGQDSMFDIRQAKDHGQANFKSAHLLNKIALVQFQRYRTVGRGKLNLLSKLCVTHTTRYLTPSQLTEP